MQKVVENIKELYERGEPVGEVIVDQVVALLRMKPRIYEPQEVALLLDVSHRGLTEAWMLLTGTRLCEAILEWRFLQACEMIRNLKPGQRQRIDSAWLVTVAHDCGWRTLGAMNRVFLRMVGVTSLKYARMVTKVHP